MRKAGILSGDKTLAASLVFLPSGAIPALQFERDGKKKFFGKPSDKDTTIQK